MTSNSISMSGTSAFNTYAYLLNGAYSSLRTAKEHIPGSKYGRISAILFSAFAFEAYVNHIGEAKLSFWGIVEPKLSWRGKLDLIAQQLGLAPDFGKRPFQTIGEIFKFRDLLAHGKTRTEEKSYDYVGKSDVELGILDPEWLKRYWAEEAVVRVLEDTRQVIELLHTRAGFELSSLGVVASGLFTQEPEARSARAIVESRPPTVVEAANITQIEMPLDVDGNPIDPIFLIGDLAVDTGISDLGLNIDHYLYGHPKVEDES